MQQQHHHRPLQRAILYYQQVSFRVGGRLGEEVVEVRLVFCLQFSSHIPHEENDHLVLLFFF